MKPGIKTSELILGILAMLLTALYASHVIPTDGVVSQVASIVGTILTSLGYTVSRTIVKGKAGALPAATP